MGNQVIKNAKWIIVCKAAQAVLQLVIGMLGARYLGPANYGLINYAKSVVAFVLPITQLGLNATLVREFVEEPDKEGEILGTSLLLCLVSSLFGVVLVTGFVSVANWGERETLIVCGLYSLSLLFQVFELIQYWFHYKQQFRFPSIVVVIAYTVVSLYKLYLLISEKNVYWFAVAYSVEYAAVGALLLGIYYRQCGPKLRASLLMAKKLLSRSRYYILSSLMVVLFHSTDHIMLKIMAGDAENGIYSAAIACAGVAAFVYAAIIDATRPAILKGKKNKSADYEKNISKLYGVITYLALAQGLGFAILAKPIVLILYGAEYAMAVPALRILVWYISFSQMGRIRNIWILAEGKQGILWKINLLGALVNVAINAVAIPMWGASGAAFASLLTQFATNFVLGFLVKSLRKNNVLLLKGIHPGFLLATLREAVEAHNKEKGQ